MLPVSIVEAKGIYGFKTELGTTEDRFRGRRRHSNTAAKLVPLIVRDREQIGGEGTLYSCPIPSSKISAISFHDRLVTN